MIIDRESDPGEVGALLNGLRSQGVRRGRSVLAFAAFRKTFEVS